MSETSHQHQASGGPPTIQDKVKKPAGVLPKNVQTWVILGVAMVMIVILVLETPRKLDPQTEETVRQAAVVDPNERRIQEYRRRIEEHAQKLAAERARLEQAQQTLDRAGELPLISPEPSYNSPQYQQPPARPEKSTIERDKEERAYKALFASSVALSYRQSQLSDRGVPSSAAEIFPPQPSLSFPFAGPAGQNPAFPFYPFGAGPVLPDQRLSATASPTADTTVEDSANTQSRESATSGENGRLLSEHLNPATAKQYRLFEGTVLEAVLTNRLTGSFAGPVNCMLTEDVYSHNRQKLLIPKGSRILGEVRQVDHLGQERLAVVFHRIIMPDGFSLDLDQFQGLNQIGETGLKDKVDRHYLKIFGVSLAIGAIAGLAQAGTRYGDDFSSGDAYRQGVSRSVAASSMRILDRFLNVLPTFTIREGHRIKIHLAGDLLVPAYADHEMPQDF